MKHKLRLAMSPTRNIQGKHVMVGTCPCGWMHMCAFTGWSDWRKTRRYLRQLHFYFSHSKAGYR